MFFCVLLLLLLPIKMMTKNIRLCVEEGLSDLKKLLTSYLVFNLKEIIYSEGKKDRQKMKMKGREENERRKRKRIEARTQNIQQPSKDLSSLISFRRRSELFFWQKKSIQFLCFFFLTLGKNLSSTSPRLSASSSMCFFVLFFIMSLEAIVCGFCLDRIGFNF